MRFGRLEPISGAHQLESFTCDDGDSLDRYLYKEALTAHDAGMARTHVRVGDTTEVLGYATVLPVEVTLGARDLPRSALGSRKAVPGDLIAKMGIAQEHQRQGHGRDLLIWTPSVHRQCSGSRRWKTDPCGSRGTRHQRCPRVLSQPELRRNPVLVHPVDAPRRGSRGTTALTRGYPQFPTLPVDGPAPPPKGAPRMSRSTPHTPGVPAPLR